MVKNVGTADRAIRIIVGAALIAVALLQPGTGFDWLGWIGVLPLLTGLLGWCPGYNLIGVNTCGKTN